MFKTSWSHDQDGHLPIYKPHDEKTNVLHMRKTKTQISFAVTAKLNSVLCFRYIDNTIHLLSKSEISSFYPSSVAEQPGFVSDPVGKQSVVFLMTPLIFKGTGEPISKKLDIV